MPARPKKNTGTWGVIHYIGIGLLYASISGFVELLTGDLLTGDLLTCSPFDWGPFDLATF